MTSNDQLTLHHFAPGEFGPSRHGRTADWWPSMNPGLLIRADVFRRLWGMPVSVSGHPNALGRRSGPGSNSDHNVDVRGTVDGMDVFPSGLVTRGTALFALECARQVGLSSIGLYPHWSRPGLHLGVRRGHGGPRPMATWGAIQRNGVQVYVSWDEALAHLPEAPGKEGA